MWMENLLKPQEKPVLGQNLRRRSGGEGSAPPPPEEQADNAAEQQAPPPPAKQKTQLFDYRYDDTDTLMNEIDEFYPYTEMAHVAENVNRFAGSFDGDWTSASLAKRRAYVETQLEYLESPVDEKRRAAQGRLLYLLQGCFAETNSAEMQLHWIIENTKLIRSVDGVSTLVYSLRDAARRYDAADVMDRAPAAAQMRERSGSSNLAPVDPFDTHSSELMDVLAMLYFIVEVSRSDETFGDELMALNPPFPLMLVNMVANLKDRMVPRGYPVKKVLLLLWKTLLACLGGMREAAKAKALSRELAGLGPEQKDFAKTTPIDIATWRRDTSTKYPTFAPSPSQSSGVPVSTESLAESIKPLPARPNYHSTEIPASHSNQAGSMSPTHSSMPQPGTPAPTPPQTPQQRPKKLQYQTDPTRPFVFPYSQSLQGLPTSLVPYAIEEADKLYNSHLFVSLGLYQLWEAREECLREERGLGRSGLIGFSSLRLDDDEDEAAEEAMRRDWQFGEEEMKAEAKGDIEGVKLAKEKRAAARRLHRVEILYRSMLPAMQNTVIVLLKLLLATVTGHGNQPPHLAQSMEGQVSSPTQDMPQPVIPPPTEEEIDVSRHREITSKAVSAIILLLLKWFKASHILKFHHLTSLLLDSNCLVLVLKIFNLQETSQMVQSQNEVPGRAFFRYLHSRGPDADRLVDEALDARKAANNAEELEGVVGENGEEVEVVHDYSWRNFFAAINLVKILQKITKHRTHRILLMCQYKSSSILKRVLRVNQPMLQLQVLKLIKSHVVYCGRKWRSTNMKIITSIYLNCRPELRNDWLVGVEADLEAEDQMVGKPQELALRSLIAFYNKRHYAAHLIPPGSALEPAHRRTDSTSGVMFEDHNLLASRRRSRLDSLSSSEHDLFPPNRTSTDMSYNPDGMIEFWMHEYEDVMREVFGEGTSEDDWDEYGKVRPDVSPGAPGPAARDDAAWIRLGELMRRGDDDAISDSESVVSVGELGEDARLEAEEEGRSMFAAMQERKTRRPSEDENTWENMSPTLKLLPRSPTDRRRSSSGGSPLRPVMGLGPMSDDLGDVFEEDMELPGPMPINTGTRDEIEREHSAVDEVEYLFNE
ncbi:N1221-domain-containing protein [Cutaneotrichosporon oleaginosum]|uniref:N1221-domain-containing protein n=1 Tax=Cutaneotrichosporon oleaginosum TaxID=879819 RepID=A0A0J0XT20_9TREE|nr:N1221-domain-containing protein [Cutaneotrichosporon oleaginosum]KLT44225.1 N1221-domain-containing protein [Cutaneotrichosporon oleaginosum]